MISGRKPASALDAEKLNQNLFTPAWILTGSVQRYVGGLDGQKLGAESVRLACKCPQNRPYGTIKKLIPWHMFIAENPLKLSTISSFWAKLSGFRVGETHPDRRGG